MKVSRFRSIGVSPPLHCITEFRISEKASVPFLESYPSHPDPEKYFGASLAFKFLECVEILDCYQIEYYGTFGKRALDSKFQPDLQGLNYGFNRQDFISKNRQHCLHFLKQQCQRAETEYSSGFHSRETLYLSECFHANLFSHF